jgi:hypothetical protein
MRIDINPTPPSKKFFMAGTVSEKISLSIDSEADVIINQDVKELDESFPSLYTVWYL